MSSFLELVTTIPQKEPQEIAEDIIKTFDYNISGCCINDLAAQNAAKKCAVIHINLLLKQGLYMPVDQYQIHYWNKVKEILEK